MEYFVNFCRAVFGGLRGGTFTYGQARIDRRIRDDLFVSLVHQEIGFFDANKTGFVGELPYGAYMGTRGWDYIQFLENGNLQI